MDSAAVCFVLLAAVLGLAGSVANGQPACTQGGVGLRFKPASSGPPYSFLTPDTREVNVTRSVPLPLIIVQALDSNNEVDPNVASITVTVSSTTRLSNKYALPMLNGEAYFSNIVVEGSDPQYVLTFTSSSAFSESALNGIELSVNVTSVLKLTSIYAIRFAQNRSLFMAPGLEYRTVLGVPLPPIVINVVTSAYVTYPTSSLLGSNYTIQAFVNTPVITLTNNFAVVLDGVATFSALTLSGSLGDGAPLPQIQFRLFNGATAQEGVAVLSTGFGTVMGFIVDYARIGFLPESESAIYSEGQNFVATSGVVLQVNEMPIRIQVLDNMFRPSPPASGLVITARCNTCPLNSVQGDVAGVVGGVATFDKLKITIPRSATASPFVLTFTAGSQGSLKVAGEKLQTGIVLVYPFAQHTSYMTFFPNPNDSLFNFQGHSQQVVLSLRMQPIRIQVLATDGRRNTTKDLTVTASATSGVQFSGTVVQKVESGIAEFKDLQFSSTKASVFPRITFTAGGSPLFLVFGQTLVTGVISIAPIESNYGLRFQPFGAGLFSLSGQPSFATTGVPLPPIIIELTTSAGSVDSSSNEIGITVSASGATLSGSFLRVSAGVAVFSSLTFVSEGPGNYILTFTAGAEGNTNVAFKSLMTGNIRLAASVTEAYAIRFRNDSYIRYAGQVVPVEPSTRTKITPPIIIELVNSAHQPSFTTMPEIFVLAQTQLSSARLSFVRSGRGASVTFLGLQIGSSFGPVLSFTVRSEKQSKQEPAVGTSIASGSLTLFSGPSPVAMLQIVANTSLANSATVYNIQMPGVNFSIPAGRSMSVVLVIANSMGTYPRSPVTGLPVNRLPDGTGISVSIQSNVPLADPQSIPVDPYTGLANFSNIRFAQTVPVSVMPIITFTATATAGSLPAILPITTGLIKVIGPSAESGVDVVAQILFDFSTFDVSAWVETLAALLNIEPLRIVVKRAYYGTGADVSPTRLNITANAVAVWYGTRLDFRVLEPLPTSRNTKAAWELVEQILSFRTSDCSLPQLYLRKTFNLSDDSSCDWFIYGDQTTSATQCVLAGGAKAFCSCYTPLIQSMGMNCLGYTPLSDLCLNTLLQNAKCKDKAITDVCNLLLPPTVPRVALLATGLFWGLVLAPLLLLKSSGFFHKLRRSEATGGKIEKLEGRVDETDLL
jgi:hypothetical protein